MSRSTIHRRFVAAMTAAAVFGLPVAFAQESKPAAPPQAPPATPAEPAHNHPHPAAPAQPAPGQIKPMTPEEVEKAKLQMKAGANQPIPAAPGTALPNCLEIEAPTFDWGDISDAEPASHTFNFKNISDRTVKITVAASCGCTVAGLEKDTYAPGETGKVTATFNPQGRNGSQTKVLTMTVIDPQGVFAQQTMTVTANVKALVTTEPPKMYLSEVDHKNGQTSKVTITARKADFKINTIESNSEFIKATLGEPQPVEINGEKLTKYDITLDIGKGAPIGNLNGQLSFTTNDEKMKVPTYFIGADVTGDIKATPPQAMLRVTSVSTGFESKVRVDSRSGTDFSITGIEIEGRSDMKLAADAVRAEEGKYYMITLSGYTPDQPGIVNGTMVISTDAQGGETIRVPFTAAVRKPDMRPTAGVAAPNTQAVQPAQAAQPTQAPAIKIAH
jgi:hypothetical protein